MGTEIHLLRVLSAFLLFAALLPPRMASAQDHVQGTFSVGLRIVDFECAPENAKRQAITVAVWYPTQETPQPFTYHAEEEVRGKLAPNASVAGRSGPYPLIVFAHGAYGSGYNSAFFMEYLASHGYIVAAADYDDMKPPAYTEQIAFSRIKGGNTGPPLLIVAVAGRFVADMNGNRDSFFAYLAEHRLPQTSFVIDEMIRLNRTRGSPFQRTIREDAIGICGHSLGGATVLGKIGAHPNRQLKDERIKAALIFSAPGYPWENTLGRITVPIMIMAGDADSPALGPDLPRRILYDRTSPPKLYLVLKAATHFAFANRGCGGLPTYQAVEQVPQVGAICRYGLAFFERYVRKDVPASAHLNEMVPEWAYYVKEERPGQVSEWGKEPPVDRTGGPGGLRKEMRDEIRKRLGR